MTSVYLDETHEAFRASVLRFMEHEVAPHADEWETSGRIPRAIWPRRSSNAKVVWTCARVLLSGR